MSSMVAMGLPASACMLGAGLATAAACATGVRLILSCLKRMLLLASSCVTVIGLPASACMLGAGLSDGSCLILKTLASSTSSCLIATSVGALGRRASLNLRFTLPYLEHSSRTVDCRRLGSAVLTAARRGLDTRMVECGLRV
jgi:hypothetical protein